MELEDGDAEEEEMPSDLADKTPKEQQRIIKFRSVSMMGWGLILILIFSDAIVDIFQELGVRTKLGSFFVSFVLAPFASNSSELLAAYNYAKKKTSKTVTIAASALEGAVVMNNCLAYLVFLIIVLVKGLDWKHSAEMICLIFVEWAIGLMACVRYY